jgi:hypothetical protein
LTSDEFPIAAEREMIRIQISDHEFAHSITAGLWQISEAGALDRSFVGGYQLV